MKSNLGNLAIVLIAFAIGFLVLNKENVSEYAMPYINDAKRGAAESAGDFAKNVLLAKAGDALTVASDKVSDLTEDAIDAVQAKTLNSLKKTVDQKFKDLADGIGVDLGGGGATQTSSLSTPVGFAIKSYTQAYFTIRNKDAGAVAYEINWKDGKIEKGQINSGVVKTVSHAWTSAGEYLIKFRIISGNAVREYDVPVSIL